MGNLDFSANADQLKELAAYMASQINVPTIGIGGGYAPIGSINFFDATVAPQDWLACDGTVYNIADYPQLADWYETQHGSKNFYGGDGTTTFAVPDLQGEFLRGTGTNSHANQGSGANVGEHQDGTAHVFLFNNGQGTFAIGGNNTFVSPTRYDSSISSSIGRVASISGQSTSAFETKYTSRPTNTSFLICVKAVVAGEVYSTEERVVGTWIDGKPLYQKTITISSDSYDLTSLSIEHIHLVNMVTNDSGTIRLFDSNYYSDGDWFRLLYANRTLLKQKGTSGTMHEVIATIQYTKTTD